MILDAKDFLKEEFSLEGAYFMRLPTNGVIYRLEKRGGAYLPKEGVSVRATPVFDLYLKSAIHYHEVITVPLRPSDRVLVQWKRCLIKDFYNINANLTRADRRDKIDLLMDLLQTELSTKDAAQWFVDNYNYEDTPLDIFVREFAEARKRENPYRQHRRGLKV